MRQGLFFSLFPTIAMTYRPTVLPSYRPTIILEVKTSVKILS
jgi:hypothetical protein